MNNDAFQKMVRDSARAKSSKEIAREAVESEFKRNEKKRKKGGDSSDSDNDDDDRKSKKAQHNDFRPRQVRNNGTGEDDDDEFELPSGYRDRAKERREGTAAPETTTQKTDKQGDDASHSSGSHSQEEEYILPVQKTQGLNLSLARKTKKELQQDASNYKTQQSKQESVETLPSTLEQAKEVLQAFVDKDPSSSTTSTTAMNPSLREYLLQLADVVLLDHRKQKQKSKTISVGVAGKTLQRSGLAMALDGHPSDYSRAWEIPREVMLQLPNDVVVDNSNSFARLDTDLIAHIDLAVAKIQRSYDNNTNHQKRSTALTFSADSTTTAMHKMNGNGDPANLHYDDDDNNDDIFGGLDDYAPPKPKAPNTNSQ